MSDLAPAFIAPPILEQPTTAALAEQAAVEKRTYGLSDDLKLTLVTSMERVAEFWRWLGERRAGLLCFDTETTGLSPEKDRIRLIQFGDEMAGWAIPWADWRGLAKEVFQRYDGELGAHNSKFDVRQICNDFGWHVWDWPWHRQHDTMGQAHILDSQRPVGLKNLADMHIDGRASQGEQALKTGMSRNKWDWGSVPIDFPPYWQYGALDPVITSHLHGKFMPQITQSYSELYDLEMGAIRVAAKMEELGVRVDLDYARDMAGQLDAYAYDIRKWLREVHGLENPTPAQLIKFFEREGVTLMDKLTSGGSQSMDKHVLETTDHEVARQVLKLRKAEKMSGTYLHNFQTFASDGFLHPNIRTMAARTGRMSITEPALQTLPRKDPVIRDAFIPRDGHAILSIDADQIEARLTAHFSRDVGLAAAFASPDDFFCVIATQCFGYVVTKGMIERDLIKGVVYGKVYGASVMKMAETAGVTFKQMQTTNALFETNYPSVRKLMQDVVNAGKRRKEEEGRGYVVTPYGRKLMSDTGKEYTLVNYLIQCHAAEILKRKMVLLDAALPPEALMILPIHDEIIFDVPVEIVHDVKLQAESVLSESEGYAVPITWSGDVLEHAWGDKYGGRFNRAAA